MKYEKQEVLQYVSEEDVKFIRLAFCDVFGKQKNISVMPCELERAFCEGIPIDASEINGFCPCDGTEASDVYLHPDPDTLTVLPWRPEHGRVVRMFCTVSDKNGNPPETDSRTILAGAVKAAAEKGYTFFFGPEPEFYLFCRDENGNPTRIPYDNAGYMDIAPEDKGENVRREICLTLEQMGITPESSYHKAGPGQNQIAFHYSESMSAADNAASFVTAVKVVAARNGLCADFSPKPLEDKPGNGFFISFSVKGNDGKKPPFSQMLAGILETAGETAIFMNPVADSYRRLGRDKAPGFAAWSENSRSQMIRIHTSTDGSGDWAQLRSPDPCANPYIAMALIIYAALYGAENNLTLPEQTENGANAPKRLPENVREAAELAVNGKFVQSCLPKSVIKAYCDRFSDKASMAE